jgi:hypothetical protein
VTSDRPRPVRDERDKTMYEITYTDGRTDTAETYEAAVAIIEAEYEEAEIGHDGDLSDGGDRTLCWADEASSVNDDGANAVASIREAR